MRLPGRRAKGAPSGACPKSRRARLQATSRGLSRVPQPSKRPVSRPIRGDGRSRSPAASRSPGRSGQALKPPPKAPFRFRSEARPFGPEARPSRHAQKSAPGTQVQGAPRFPEGWACGGMGLRRIAPALTRAPAGDAARALPAPKAGRENRPRRPDGEAGQEAGPKAGPEGQTGKPDGKTARALSPAPRAQAHPRSRASIASATPPRASDGSRVRGTGPSRVRAAARVSPVPASSPTARLTRACASARGIWAAS